MKVRMKQGGREGEEDKIQTSCGSDLEVPSLFALFVCIYYIIIIIFFFCVQGQQHRHIVNRL